MYYIIWISICSANTFKSILKRFLFIKSSLLIVIACIAWMERNGMLFKSYILQTRTESPKPCIESGVWCSAKYFFCAHFPKRMEKTCNIQRIIPNCEWWVPLNKMVLIKSFLTGALYDHSKLRSVHLNEGDKVRECYSCLKLLI